MKGVGDIVFIGICTCDLACNTQQITQQSKYVRQRRTQGIGFTRFVEGF